MALPAMTLTSLVPPAATSAQPSRQSTPLPPSSSPPPSSSNRADTTLDPAAVLLIRRTLCAHRASQPSTSHGDSTHPDRASPRQIEDLLPLMTGSREVDLELYVILAAVVRDYISPWYTRITPDGEFVDEVVKIIAHAVRALEERAKKVELEDLLLNEIPGVLNAHIVASSHQTPSSLPNSRLSIYHALCPHPALSPVPDPSNPASVEAQKHNERAYRLLLVQDLLRILLPPEDLENDCLRTLVEEILSETVLGNLVIGKGSQGWVWWMGIAKVADTILHRRGRKADDDKNSNDSTPPPTTIKGSYETLTASLTSLFYTSLHVLLAVFTTLRFIIIALLTLPSLPHRSSATSRPSSPSQSDPTPAPTPILASRILTTASLLLSLDTRKPWLRGSLQLLQQLLLSGPGRVGASDGLLDRYLSHPLTPLTHPSPATIVAPLRTLRLLLQQPQPSIPPPSATEQQALKRHTAVALLALLPPSVRRAWLGTADANAQAREVETGILDVFGGDVAHAEPGEGGYVLKGLVFRLLDLVLASCVPELAGGLSSGARGGKE